MTAARRWLPIAAALLLLGAAVGAFILLRWSNQREVALAHLPARPSLSAFPAELEARITDAEERIESFGSPVAPLVALAGLYHGNGFYAEAQQLYAALRELQPGEPRWLHRLADIHANFGELDRAIPLWEETVARAPDYAPARVRLGESLLKTGRVDDARAVFQQLHTREPRNPYALLGLARCDLAREDWAAARPRLEEAAQLSSGLVGGDLLVTVYERTGDATRAEALRARQKSHGLYVGIADPWIEEVVEHSYDSFRLALESGAANLRQDRARSQRLLERALALDPNRAGLRFHAATVADEQGDSTRARRELEAAVRLDPTLTDAWALLVRVLDKGGDTNGAWRVLNEALAANPDSPALLLERARRYRDQGRIGAAIGDYRRVTRLRRDEALAFIELASLLFRQEQHAEAIAVLEQGLQAEPGHPAALAIITFASIVSRQQEQALRWLREAAAQPRLPPAEFARLRQAYQDTFGEAAPVVRP